MRRRDSDLLARARPSRLSYSYSQCTSRSRSGSLESDLRGVFSDVGDSSELQDVDDKQLLPHETSEKRETVRVTVRFRPLLAKETSSRRPAWNVHAEKGTVEAAVSGSGQTARRQELYAFDEVYGGQHSTQTIYDGLARSIARSALDGIHGTIFAYGQTSSGKTYTMQGSGLRSRRMTMSHEQEVETEEERRPDAGDGLVQLAVKDLFDEMARRVDTEYLVRVSYLEVYNETVKDLLVSSSLATTGKRRNSTVHIREHPVTGVFTDNSERVVTNARGVLQALRDGEKQRAVEATRMNEHSSRSHSIFRVVIEAKTRLESPVPSDDDEDDAAGVEVVRVGCLNFVDLAGSESARAISSGGKKLTTESGNINRSLLALSRVVVALSNSKSPSQQDHVNFRDSKLTRILQPSLSGAARVLFVCCASPSPTYIEDTRSTLKFASRAKRIKVNASVNEVVDQRARALMELSRENQLLRRQLETFASASRDEMDAMENYIVRQRMRIVSLEAAAAASSRTSFVVRAAALDTIEKDGYEGQLRVPGFEEVNSLTDLDNEVLEMDLSDGENTYVDSQFGSLTESPLLVADAACATCEALDAALASAKTRELESHKRIEQLEAYIDQLQHREDDKRSSCATVTTATDEGPDGGGQCVLSIENDETDEITALASSEEGGAWRSVHARSFSLSSAALLAVVVDTLKKRSPVEALVIVGIVCTCVAIVLASAVWNIATGLL